MKIQNLWVQILQASGQIAPGEIRKIAAYVGVPELASDAEGGMNKDMPGVSGQDEPGGVGLENSSNSMKNNPTGLGTGGEGTEAGNTKETPNIPGSAKKSSRSRA